MRACGFVVVALAVGFLAPGPAAAAAVVVGAEFQINSYTSGTQTEVDVAGSNQGFVVVWTDEQRDGSFGGVFARRLSTAGTPLGVDFQVNSYTSGRQHAPRIAVTESGFVAVWESQHQDGDDNGIFGRRFTSAGSPLAAEFQVATQTTGTQRYPVVAANGGGFVVAWESPGDYHLRGIATQRFSTSGEPLGEQSFVNTYITGEQYRAAVAMDGQRFVVVWMSADQDGSDGGIFARRFDSLGFSESEGFQVNTLTARDDYAPNVARNGAGFIVTWSASDGNGAGKFARRLSSAGAPLSSEFRVNSELAGYQGPGRVGGGSGSAFVPWSDLQSNNLVGGRMLDAQGLAAGQDLQIAGFNYLATTPAAAQAASSFIVVWSKSVDLFEEQGDVFGRRVLVLADFDVDGDGLVLPLTDSLLALRYAFGFRGAVLINGAIGAGCTRCDAPSLEAYLAGKT